MGGSWCGFDDWLFAELSIDGDVKLLSPCSNQLSALMPLRTAMVLLTMLGDASSETQGRMSVCNSCHMATSTQQSPHERWLLPVACAKLTTSDMQTAQDMLLSLKGKSCVHTVNSTIPAVAGYKHQYTHAGRSTNCNILCAALPMHT